MVHVENGGGGILIVCTVSVITPLYMCVCSPGEDELEISPYDDTQMDTRLASLVAGKTYSYSSISINTMQINTMS